MNVLPEGLQGVVANVRSRLGEALNKPEWKGSGEEWQELQRLRNIDIRSFSGSAQTMAEAARQMIEKGVQAGGSPEQVKRGMQMMRQAAEINAKNLEAGSTPEALKVYTQQQGGVSPSGLLGPSPSIAPTPQPLASDKQKRLQELRAKKGVK
jgi:alkanesulfonate monooxygenase SsuD/methylene tetrahydromethanopterin reductase-like flavin-dependent oxidoreductase (luciferase family)